MVFRDAEGKKLLILILLIALLVAPHAVTLFGFLLYLIPIKRILILCALMYMAVQYEKYQSAPDMVQKNTIRRYLGFSCLALWMLCVLEINSVIANQYSNNYLLKCLFQLLFFIALIVGLYVYPQTKLTTFSRVRPYQRKSCPICMDDIKEGIKISRCNHSICYECAYNYLKHAIVDISQYPIQCFQHNCDTAVHATIINDIIGHQMKHSNATNSAQCAQLLAKYERFSLITSTPKHFRIDCPNAECNNVLLRNRPPLSQQISPSKYPMHGSQSHYKPLNSVNRCQADLCTNSFSMLKWKYNCTICGGVFCFECVRFNMQILELGYLEAVPLCMTCFTDLFCVQCPECNTMICFRCEQPWHNVCDKSDAQNGVCKMVKCNDKRALIDAKTKKMMKAKKFQACPRCGMMIEKTSGCNHITHTGCPRATEPSGTHFCYCCGDVLYGRYHNQEFDGTPHFAKGVYKDCRKANRLTSSTQNCLVM